MLNLEKCIGCNTWPVTCKNVWASREGVECAWFNNLETRPGIGFPKDRENRKRWNGRCERTAKGHLQQAPRLADGRLGLPLKKVCHNWSTGSPRSAPFICYPLLESGQPTVCSEISMGRIRYLGVMLQDADRIAEAAAVAGEQDFYDVQLGPFLGPSDPKAIAYARAEGSPEIWITTAQRSLVWKMAMHRKTAFPLHPEYRTRPMTFAAVAPRLRASTEKAT